MSTYIVNYVNILFSCIPCHQQTTSCFQESRRTASKHQAASWGTLASGFPDFWQSEIDVSKNLEVSVLWKLIELLIVDTDVVSVAHPDEAHSEVHDHVLQDVQSNLLLFSFPACL